VVENDVIIRLAAGPLHTVFGTFQEVLYADGPQESIALVMGEVEQGQSVFCRVHSQCLTAHVFNSVEYDYREQMALAQSVIEQHGRGDDMRRRCTQAITFPQRTRRQRRPQRRP
jgi:GTP cyclohydrolase II